MIMTKRNVFYNKKQNLKMTSTSQTQHALYMFTRTFDRYKHESFLNLRTYSDGLPFARMISSIGYFSGIVDDLQISAEKWTQRLENLKKILTQMQAYVGTQGQKVLKINDLELVQIAKNNSQQQILKMFQVVIAVLMQTPQKQDYIQRIMGLDERSQQALVIVVQNAMQERISDSQNNNTNLQQSFEQLNSLQNENHILTQEINELCKENQLLLKKNIQLQQKVHESQQQIQKARNLNIQMYMNNTNKSSQMKRENSLVQTLKKRMIQMARQHQLQLTKFNDEIYHLKGKLSHYKEIQQELIERNKILQDKMKNFTAAVEDQRKRLDKMIDEKDTKIKKLQFQLDVTRNKVRELSQDIEVNDLNLRMELQRKQVRFKQLQKQVKNRLIEPQMEMPGKKSSSQQPLTPRKQQQNEEQLEYLKSEVQKLRNSSRQLQRENLKLKKKSQKVQAIENQKKKLQKIILDVSKCRDSQIQMLVVSLYDLRNENIRMHKIISQLKYREESKFD